jgi:ribosomal protein L11 methyltransferase
MPAPLLIGSRLRVVAPGTARASDGRIDVVMAPGAFGSGEHETTASCLELLAELDGLCGASVLDLGSGTGILAIAALLLGAERALCVDLDPQAVECARRNCGHNGVGERARHLAGELRDVAETGFDLVVANLHGDVLLALAPELVGRARPGGRLLLSGIAWEQRFDVRQRLLRLGCVLGPERMLEEYTTLLAHTAPRPAGR